MPRTYTVPDISCEHCVNAISDAVRPLAGVDAVDVDVAAKTVTVAGDFDDGAVRSAIDEAGYAIG